MYLNLYTRYIITTIAMGVLWFSIDVAISSYNSAHPESNRGREDVDKLAKQTEDNIDKEYITFRTERLTSVVQYANIMEGKFKKTFIAIYVLSLTIFLLSSILVIVIWSARMSVPKGSKVESEWSKNNVTVSSVKQSTVFMRYSMLIFSLISLGAFSVKYIWDPGILLNESETFSYKAGCVLPLTFLGGGFAFLGWLMFMNIFIEFRNRLFRDPVILVSLVFLSPSVFLIIRRLLQNN